MRYSRTNRPPIKVRTLNPAEIAVVQHLEAQGYTVVKKGWPDFLAWRDREVRFIEVKTSPRGRLSASQGIGLATRFQ